MNKFKRVMIVIFAVTALFACMVGNIFASHADSGLLLGLRSKGPKRTKSFTVPRNEYRTAWIYPHKDGFRMLTRKHILVPRSDGFWEMQVQFVKHRDWEEEVAFSVPLGVKRTFAPSVDTSQTSGYRAEEIIFVGNDYCSRWTSSWGYTKGAAHPWNYHQLQVYPIEGRPKKAVRIQDIFGGVGWKVLKRTAMDYKKNSLKGERLSDRVYPTNWGLIRSEGRWVVRGFLGYASEAVRGFYAVFDLKLTPPKSLVSHDRLAFSWNRIKRAVPGAIDAFSSPEKDVLVIMTPKKLYVYDISGKKSIGKASAVFRLKKPSAPVMAQWAEGPFIDKWTKVVKSGR